MRFKDRGDGMALIKAMLLTVAIVAGVNVVAQQKKPHMEIPTIAPKSEDVSTIEGIVTASYETISGGVGVPRQWSRDLSLFDSHSRSVAVSVNAKTGAITTHSTNEREFAEQDDASLVKDGFTERELAHTVHRFGNVATVLSSYEGKSAATGKVATRGVNIFQLYFDGKRWWILSMVWDQERPDNPIPPELLPKN